MFVCFCCAFRSLFSGPQQRDACVTRDLNNDKCSSTTCFMITCFLLLPGDSKGYGFVEFAHNRVTLERVQQSINGSILEGSILYCSLVSEKILSYEDTHATALYCVSTCIKIPADIELSKSLQNSQSYTLVSGNRVIPWLVVIELYFGQW